VPRRDTVVASATAPKRSDGSAALRPRERTRETWRVGGRRGRRRLGRSGGPSAESRTRRQAGAELRRFMANTKPTRRFPRTVEEAGTPRIDHLEHVMECKRTAIVDYRRYLRKHRPPTARQDRGPLGEDDPEPPSTSSMGSWASRSSSSGRPPTPSPSSTDRRDRAPRSAHRRLRVLSKEDLEAVVRGVPTTSSARSSSRSTLCAAMTACARGS